MRTLQGVIYTKETTMGFTVVEGINYSKSKTTQNECSTVVDVLRLSAAIT
jgi:hypothetical protein